MRLNVKFSEQQTGFNVKFGELQTAGSGGYEKGYEEGYKKGEEKGYTNGYTEGETKGIEQGKQAEYDRFWDAFQENGNRTSYAGAFVDYYWNPDTLRPKYICKVVGAGSSMFARCYWRNPNVVEPMDISHISIDVTEATTCDQIFANANVKSVTLIFSDKVTSLKYAFTKGGGQSKAMDNITLLVPNPNCIWNNAFDYHEVTELNLLDGTVIGTNGFNVQRAIGLPKESIISIINALSTTTSGLAVTLSKTAVNNAFTDDEWGVLISTKPNWNISLI